MLLQAVRAQNLRAVNNDCSPERLVGGYLHESTIQRINFERESNNVSLRGSTVLAAMIKRVVTFKIQ